MKEDGSVAVHASCEMPEWKATRYRKTAVVFEEGKYFVASHVPLAGGTFRYVLEPWPEDLHDSPGRTVHYTEAYVLERAERQRAQAKIERRAVGLFFVTWLLGFLPSGTKLRLNQRYGLDPVAVTQHSLFLEYLVLVNLTVLLTIAIFGAGVAPAFGVEPQAVASGLLSPVRLFFMAAALVPDLTIRHNCVLRGGMQQYGFGEWLFRRLGAGA